MAVDGPRRGRPKGTPASKAQAEAGKANIKKAHAARKERALARKALAEKPRWKKLEDGDIGVGDLTMDELIEGTTANNDGTWEGKRHRFNTRWLGRMETERRRRIKRGIEKLAPMALEALEDILGDDDARPQQMAAVKMVVEYEIGKVPDVVHVGAETEYDRLQQTAFRIVRGADAVTVEELPSGDTVPGEVVEE